MYDCDAYKMRMVYQIRTRFTYNIMLVLWVIRLPPYRPLSGIGQDPSNVARMYYLMGAL